MTYGKTIEYENIVIRSLQSNPMRSWLITVVQIKYNRFVIFY